MSLMTKAILDFLVLLLYVVMNLGWSLGRNSHSLATDKAALLAFKSGITDDPHSTLANWNHSVQVCRFNGVRCGPHRVKEIDLRETDLVGPLSPSISNLTSLRYLRITDARLFGGIPIEFSSLRRLRSLLLHGNNLHGQIPVSIFLLPYLKIFTIMGNNMGCTLLPEYFSNCSLRSLDVAENACTGDIPKEIGNCVHLLYLNLYNNRFSGVLPHSLANITRLRNLDIENNGFVGELPAEIIRNLPDVWYLHLSDNYLKSHDGNTNLHPFFNALRNSTQLKEIELGGMGLGGRLPSSIGQLGVSLKSMQLQENHIFGTIPAAIFNYSNLMVLNLTSNLMSGTIPSEISNSPRLEQLVLSHNNFSGQIPEALGRFRHLGLLDMSHNEFSGEITPTFRNLSQLNHLFLNNNRLFGKIPPSLGQCNNLQSLDLSHNSLTGQIPPTLLSGISELRIFINLSHNRLQGNLPLELSKLRSVQEMDFSSNNLTGTIFAQISSCIEASSLNFSRNFLQGNLPDTIGELKNLQSLDLSWNNLTGDIPASLGKIMTLTYLNLSFNDFNGEIPSNGGIFSSVNYSSFLRNPLLCGKFSQLHKCKHKRIHSNILWIGFIIFAVILAACCACCCGFTKFLKSKKYKAPLEPTSPKPIYNIPRITYRELTALTADFDDSRLIGSGKYGRVYRGDLLNGAAIAVKVLYSQWTEIFHRECSVLKIIRHRNLMKVKTVCSLMDFKALIFPYMENGSLESHLHGPSKSGGLSLVQRVKICCDVAEGIAYLHNYCPEEVVHCNLKPSNVLLDRNMTALVSDFGTATVLMDRDNRDYEIESLNSNPEMLIGSFGYTPPEYRVCARASTKGDVYSFGIILLEMVTGKRPTDDMFIGGLTLHNWVKSHFHGDNIEFDKFVDFTLARALEDIRSSRIKDIWKVTIGALADLGIHCAQDVASFRPSMLDVAVQLRRLNTNLSGKGPTYRS